MIDPLKLTGAAGFAGPPGLPGGGGGAPDPPLPGGGGGAPDPPGGAPGPLGAATIPFLILFSIVVILDSNDDNLFETSEI